MSLTIVPERCLGCGACEYACPTGAIRRPAVGAGNVFWIETNLCNDCTDCVATCPVDCIVPDPDTITCTGRGCPVAPERRGLECTRLVERCPRCDEVLWRDPAVPAGDWWCPRCDGGRAVGCPKTLATRRGRSGQQPPRRPSDELYRLRDERAGPG